MCRGVPYDSPEAADELYERTGRLYSDAEEEAFRLRYEQSLADELNATGRIYSDAEEEAFRAVIAEQLLYEQSLPLPLLTWW